MKLILLITLFLPAQTWAYMPGIHEQLTGLAVDKYNESQSPQKRLSPEVRAAIVAGSRKEDTDVFTKLMNWHFYNPHKNLGETWFGAQRSLNQRFALLVDLVGKQLKESPRDWVKIGENLGRLAHYFQDLTCPPHAVPIYHDFGDRFDRYKPSGGFQPAAFAIPSQGRPPQELLLSVFNKTASLLGEPLAIRKDKQQGMTTWGGFWAGLDTAGFGSYGVFGNKYGRNKLFANGALYEIQTSSFDDLTTRQWQESIRATAELLVWVRAQ
jgi:hypothetical protein